jgi:hypothetical protein
VTTLDPAHTSLLWRSNEFVSRLVDVPAPGVVTPEGLPAVVVSETTFLFARLSRFCVTRWTLDLFDRLGH